MSPYIIAISVAVIAISVAVGIAIVMTRQRKDGGGAGQHPPPAASVPFRKSEIAGQTMTLVGVPGDGHCMYHAVLTALGADAERYLGVSDMRSLRNAVADRIDTTDSIRTLYDICREGGFGDQAEYYIDTDLCDRSQRLTFDEWRREYAAGVRGKMEGTEFEIATINEIASGRGAVVYARVKRRWNELDFDDADVARIRGLIDTFGGGSMRVAIIQETGRHFEAWVSEAPLVLNGVNPRAR